LRFEEKYGKGTAPFGINHILFVDENSNAIHEKTTLDKYVWGLNGFLKYENYLLL